MKNLKKYVSIEKQLMYPTEEIDRKNNLADEITFLIKNTIVRVKRNPDLSYEEQIKRFRNKYKLSKDNIKKKIEKTKFNTKILKDEVKINKNNIIDFFRD